MSLIQSTQLQYPLSGSFSGSLNATSLKINNSGSSIARLIDVSNSSNAPILQLIDNGLLQLGGAGFSTGAGTGALRINNILSSSPFVVSVDGYSQEIFSIDGDTGITIGVSNIPSGVRILTYDDVGDGFINVGNRSLSLATRVGYIGLKFITGSILEIKNGNSSTYGTLNTGRINIYATSSIALNITGSTSITGSLSATSITGSIFGILKTKSGTIPSSSFTGSTKTSSIIFTSSFANPYAVTITGEDIRSWTIENKTLNGFNINSNSSNNITGSTYWIAIQYGESN